MFGLKNLIGKLCFIINFNKSNSPKNKISNNVKKNNGKITNIINNTLPCTGNHIEQPNKSQPSIPKINKKNLFEFCRRWIEYANFLFVFIDEVYIAHRKSSYSYLLEKNRFKEYHNHIDLLRELLFKVGEENLIISKNRSWEKLQTKTHMPTGMPIKNFLTPFSLLLEFDNPCLAINENDYMNEHAVSMWEASWISLRFINTLSYKYSFLKKLRI